MDLVTFYRRRPRNRPSLHPRTVLFRQFRYKLYRKQKALRDARSKARWAFCYTLSYVLAAALGCLLPCIPSGSYVSSSGALLISYTAFNALRLIYSEALSHLEGYASNFGSNGSYGLLTPCSQRFLTL